MKHELVQVPPTDFVSERLAKALAHPLRVKILVQLTKRAMSVTGFVRLHPQYSHSRIYGHFCVLEKYECIELIEIKAGGKRRGGREHFYRATVRSLFDESSWASLPESLQNRITSGVFSTLIDRVADATKAGTIDTRPDRHFTWQDPYFDEQAWDETIEEVDALFHRIPIRQAEAAARLAKSNEEPIPVTIALACFESPQASEPAE